MAACGAAFLRDGAFGYVSLPRVAAAYSSWGGITMQQEVFVEPGSSDQYL